MDEKPRHLTMMRPAKPQRAASGHQVCTEGLSKSVAAWAEAMQASFRIFDPAGVARLEVAARAREDELRYRAALKKDGLFYLDRHGVRRRHPAADAVDRARRTFLNAMRALDLEIEE